MRVTPGVMRLEEGTWSLTSDAQCPASGVMKIPPGVRCHRVIRERENHSNGGLISLSSTHVIAVALQKGGCTKTTTTCTLAAAAATEGYTVCVVDTDRQCNATSTFITEIDELQEKGTIPSVADAILAKTPADQLAVPIPARF